MTSTPSPVPAFMNISAHYAPVMNVVADTDLSSCGDGTTMEDSNSVFSSCLTPMEVRFLLILCVFMLTQTTMESQVPRTLQGWRVPGPGGQEEEAVWELAREALKRAGVDLWRTHSPFQKPDPSQVCLSTGSSYLTPLRGEMWALRLRAFNSHVSEHWHVFMHIFTV